MKLLPLFFSFSLLGAGIGQAEDWLDRVDGALTFSGWDGNARLRLSGTLDLEGYAFQQPAPGLIDATGDKFLQPRLTLFLDSQLGPKVYLFAQARVDRGFDPSDGGSETRLDEYAIRFTPWEDSRFNLQIGQFATIVGRWNERHLSWDNPFINAPFPYENFTRVSYLEPPASFREFGAEAITSRTKYEFTPIVWGPAYTSGLSIAGRIGKFDYAAELKNASLASPPQAWSVGETGFEHPTVSGRLGFRPNQAWNLGLSASGGAYLLPEAESLLPPGRDRGDYRQFVLAQDIGFAWHHLQIWAEFFESRFEVPHVGNADTFAYYIEAKYKFAAQLFGAVRWNQQLFATVQEDRGKQATWGRDAWRVDTAIGYRFTPHTQLKLQYDFSRGDTSRSGFGHLLGFQFTVRF